MIPDHAAVALNLMSEAVICTDLAGAVTYLNPAASALTGFSKHAALGRSIQLIFDLVGIPEHVPYENPVLAAARSGARRELGEDALLYCRTGLRYEIEGYAMPLPAHAGIAGVLLSFRDVTSTRTAVRALAHRAHHDALTNLPNRLLLQDRLAHTLQLMGRTGGQAAVLYLDFNRFKEINDTLGHEAGDKLLTLAAERLQSCVRRSDTLSRVGGDEFVIVLSEVKSRANAQLISQKIAATLNQPYPIQNASLEVSVSIGVACYPEDGTEPEVLLHLADRAMYATKTNVEPPPASQARTNGLVFSSTSVA